MVTSPAVYPMSEQGPRLLPNVLVRGFPALLAPVAERLVRMRVRPNVVTSASLVVLIGAGAAFGFHGPRLGAALLLLSGLLDILDGQVARLGGMVSRFGAFMDSTLDRIGEAALFAGIGIYFLTAAGQAMPTLAMIAVLGALTGAFMVSYARARAEGLGIECRVGLAQRAERILGVGIPTVFFGAGPRGILLLVIVLSLAVLSWITVMQRVASVFRATDGAERGGGGGSGAHGERD